MSTASPDVSRPQWSSLFVITNPPPGHFWPIFIERLGEIKCVSEVVAYWEKKEAACFSKAYIDMSIFNLRNLLPVRLQCAHYYQCKGQRLFMCQLREDHCLLLRWVFFFPVKANMNCFQLLLYHRISFLKRSRYFPDCCLSRVARSVKEKINRMTEIWQKFSSLGFFFSPPSCY